jgi:phytoene synthase
MSDSADSRESAAHEIPPGSLRHFAVLYSGTRARATLTALYAFERQLADTVRLPNHDVAHTRLQWWRGEVDRLLAGNAAHPITRTLQSLPPAADRTLLHEALVAADIDLARMTLANAAELEAYCFRASGSLQTLAAQACAGTRTLSPSERDFARSVGAAVRQAEIIRDVRHDLEQGRLRVPLDRLEAAGVDPLTVGPGTTAENLLDLLQDWATSVRLQLLALPGMLATSEKPAQRHGLILAALHVKLVERLEHSGELARAPPEVPSWQRLWTAWRTAIRYR